MPSALVYCAEGGHWIFEWNVHSLSYFIEYGQISKWEKHWGLWTNQRKTETNCNILHIYESWHVHDSSHIWVIKTLPRHFKKTPSSRRFPLPCSERVGWGEKTRHGGACGGDGGERRDGGDGGERRNETSFPRGGIQLLRILQQSRCPLFGHLMLWREVLHWWLTNGWNVIKILLK